MALGVLGCFQHREGMDNPGEYRLKYSISFQDGEQIVREVFFAGELTGRENTDLRFRQNELRDLARITGGEYIHYRDIGKIDKIVLSDNIPMLSRYHHWTRHGLFLLMFMIVLGAELFLRRQAGLK